MLAECFVFTSYQLIEPISAILKFKGHYNCAKGHICIQAQQAEIMQMGVDNGVEMTMTVVKMWMTTMTTTM